MSNVKIAVSLVFMAHLFTVHTMNWTDVLTLGGTDNSYNGELIDVGRDSFNDIFRNSSDYPIIRRTCQLSGSYACVASHQNIYYKRLRNKNSFDAYSNMKETWSSTDNVLGTDFNLYSSLQDALSNTNAWTACNYDDEGVAAFRDCGPTGYVSAWTSDVTVWGSRHRNPRNVIFSIYTPTEPTVDCDASDHWELILDHQNANNGYFFSSTLRTTGLENENDPTANTYSIIGWFNNNSTLRNKYKVNNEKYKLKLIYNNADSTTSEYIWTQTSWITDSTITGANLSSIPDQSGHGCATFYGLGLSTDSRTYLDGDGAATDCWYQSVGSNVEFYGGIPGDYRVAYSSSLYIWNPTACNQETSDPTSDPTNDPTDDPTYDPTVLPTLIPSQVPTYLNCEDSSNIKHLDWSDIMDYGRDELPEIGYDIDVSSKDQQISINIELDYLGYSYIDNKYGFGTTYHLGFEQFEDMSLISNCDNRMESSYTNKQWQEYWQYSEYPYLNGSIGDNNFLAYPPPSKYWTIAMDVNNSCSKIKYSALFSWRNLIKCKSNDGETMAVDVDIDNEFINMSGIFFVDVLSPVSMITDIGYYYKYQLLYYPFKISIQKSIDILTSTNIFIFTASIINVGRTDEDDIFKMFLLTESALDIPLINPSLLFSPNDEENPFIFSKNETECLSFTSNICSQIWEITANVDCPYTFSGVYAFQFGTICDGSDQNSNCENYTDTYGDIVSLSTSLIFEDLICDDILWKFEYNAQVTFYNDSAYLTSIPKDYQFVVGEDRIYVQVIVDDFDVDYNGYSMIDTKLLNVWLCTISTNDKLTLDENNLTHTGCFSSEIDSDGPYHIIVNYNESFSNDARHEYDTFNNIVRFSFIVPDTITRDTLYIQTQLGLQFIEQDSNSRRRLLTSQNDQDHANQMFHHFEGVQLTIAETNEYDVDSNATQNDDENKGNNIYIAIIAALCCILLFGGICFVIIYKRKHCKKFKHNYGNVVSEQVVVDEIQNNDTVQQSIMKDEEDDI